MPPTSQVPGKKRNRKRKRRQASSSSSSSSSSEEESSPVSKPVAKAQPLSSEAHTKVDPEETLSSSSSSSSSESSDSSEESDGDVEMRSPKEKRRLPSRSPSPVDHVLPTNIYLQPSNEEEKRKDAEMKEKFRKFWMMTTAEGFKDELGQIQKEPNMTQSKLSMLIDALSTGANVYMPSNNGTGSTSERSEVELLLGVHK